MDMTRLTSAHLCIASGKGDLCPTQPETGDAGNLTLPTGLDWKGGLACHGPAPASFSGGMQPFPPALGAQYAVSWPLQELDRKFYLPHLIGVRTGDQAFLCLFFAYLLLNYPRALGDRLALGCD